MKISTVKLGSICTFQSGGTPSRSIPEYWEGNIPWITTVALNGGYINEKDTGERITETALAKSAAKLVPAQSLMVGTRVGVGKVAINTVPMSTSQDVVSLIGIDEEKWYKPYLSRFLQGKSHDLQSQSRGATIKGIKIETLSELNVPLISLEEQIRISTLLETVETLILTRKQQLTELDTLVKARFVEMFGVYPDNSMGWKTCTIRDIVADVRYGSSRPAVDGGKYPYLRMNNITYSGELDLSDVKRIDVPESELPKCTVRRGDVLFNRTNSKELVGKTCVYNRDEMMVLAGFVIRVRVNERILPEFLSAFLNADFSKQMLLSMCKTAIGQANINAQEMQNISLYLPPIDLQRQFANFKEQAEMSKLLVQRQLEELEILKASLMQKYFG